MFMLDCQQFFQDIKLKTNGWKFFGKIHAFLQLFAGFTFIGEGEKFSIFQVFSAMDVFLKYYKQKKKFNLNPKV